MAKDLPVALVQADLDRLPDSFLHVFLILSVPELQGEPEDVCREKCRLAFEKLHAPCVVDDTSLSFNALGGLPGVYMFAPQLVREICFHSDSLLPVRKWFMQKCGHEGLNKMLDGFDDRTAIARCVIGFASSSGTISVFVGETRVCNSLVLFSFRSLSSTL
jgi:inosine triphosphate pyrophosphatase